jgi:hypothetical protein
MKHLIKHLYSSRTHFSQFIRRKQYMPRSRWRSGKPTRLSVQRQGSQQNRSQKKRSKLTVAASCCGLSATAASLLASSAPAHPPRKSRVTSSAARPPSAPRDMNPTASAAIFLCSGSSSCLYTIILPNTTREERKEYRGTPVLEPEE